MYSSDLGKNWNLVDSFPGIDKSYIKERTPVDLKVDYDGSLFFIVDTNYYYKKDILTEPKIIKHEIFLKHNDYFFIPEGKDIFLINNYHLFKLDKKTLDLIEYSFPSVGFKDLNHHEGTFFCLGGGELYESKDTMKTWELIKDKFSFDSWPPRLFVTRKGTIIVGDSYYGLNIGRRVNSIIERNNEYIAIFPNPAREYIEISGIESHTLKGVVAEDVRIFDVLGECVLTTPPLRDTPSEKGNIRVDVSVLPAGVYCVRIGEWVGKFMVVR
ncbi:MAG: T9SS type A sorting domain-containing protein [Candidatus Kapabacteria bacterium]|nr:T9SS type A sorting domain-containing protein [Candidatus Kapabacteria bacterium]